MVLDLYEKFGFELTDTSSEDTVWKLGILNYKNKNKFIGVSNDQRRSI